MKQRSPEAGGDRRSFYIACSLHREEEDLFPRLNLTRTRCRINEKRKRQKRLKSESPEERSGRERQLSEPAYSPGNLGNRTNALKYVARVIALGFGAIKDNRHLENRTLLNVAMAKLARSNGPDPKINTL
ncbi:hypothetical protein K0M31_015400 [Melipona bicolor]|uniref:Uncharacterized protein n=1 Tax=Melipona bicolor TaxID=60889 RepID=A0AA40FFW7_9HYME|nr:hypothetical protein K0M31_015400 [Melipona bicolor]